MIRRCVNTFSNVQPTTFEMNCCFTKAVYLTTIIERISHELPRFRDRILGYYRTPCPRVPGWGSHGRLPTTSLCANHGAPGLPELFHDCHRFLVCACRHRFAYPAFSSPQGVDLRGLSIPLHRSDCIPSSCR